MTIRAHGEEACLGSRVTVLHSDACSGVCLCVLRPRLPPSWPWQAMPARRRHAHLRLSTPIDAIDALALPWPWRPSPHTHTHTVSAAAPSIHALGFTCTVTATISPAPCRANDSVLGISTSMCALVAACVRPTRLYAEGIRGIAR